MFQPSGKMLVVSIHPTVLQKRAVRQKPLKMLVPPLLLPLIGYREEGERRVKMAAAEMRS